MISGITQTRCLPSRQPCSGYLTKDLHFNGPISLSETDCDRSLSLFFHSGVASMTIFPDIFENPYCKNWNYLIMFISSCKTTRKYIYKNNFWNNYDFIPQRESPKLLTFLGVNLAIITQSWMLNFNLLKKYSVHWLPLWEWVRAYSLKNFENRIKYKPIFLSTLKMCQVRFQCG